MNEKLNKRNIVALAAQVNKLEKDVLSQKKAFQNLQGLIQTLNLRVEGFNKLIAKIAQDKYGTGPTT